MLLFHQQHDTTCREDEGDLVENQQEDGLMTQQTGAAVHGHSLFSPTSKKK